MKLSNRPVYRASISHGCGAQTHASSASRLQNPVSIAGIVLALAVLLVLAVSAWVPASQALADEEASSSADAVETQADESPAPSGASGEAATDKAESPAPASEASAEAQALPAEAADEAGSTDTAEKRSSESSASAAAPKETAVQVQDDGPMGGLSVRVEDALAEKTGATPQGDASFEGMTFGIYDADGKQVATVSADETGMASTANDALPLGTYTVKQQLDGTEAYKANEAWVAGIVVQVATEGQIADAGTCSCEVKRGAIAITKVDEDLYKASKTTGAANGKASLKGAVYRVYNASKAAVVVNNKTYEPWKKGAGNKAIMEIETNAKGLAVSGAKDGPYTEKIGLPWGTYRIEEKTASEKGYQLNSSWTGKVEVRGEKRYDADTVAPESVFKGGVKVKVYDADTSDGKPQGGASFKDAQFVVVSDNGDGSHTVVNGKDFANEQVVLTMAANDEGIAQTDDSTLPYGSYKIRMAKSQTGTYAPNSSWEQSFSIDRNGDLEDLTSKSCAVSAVHGGVTVSKIDADTKEGTPQGDATFSKTTFEITNQSANPVIVGGKSYTTGQVVLTLSIESGAGVSSAADILPAGTYSVKETTAPAGYTLNSTWNPSFTIDKPGEVARLTDNPAADTVIRGGVTVKKLNTSTRAGVSGAKIEIVNASAAPVYVGGKSYAKDQVVMTLTTGTNGIASTESNALPYGTYTMRESAAPNGYEINKNWKPSFQIRESGKMVQANDLLDSQKGTDTKGGTKGNSSTTPKTGDTNALPIVIIAAIAVIALVFVFVARRRSS